MSVDPHGTAIFRNDEVPLMLPSRVARYVLAPGSNVRAGQDIDAFATLGATPRLIDAKPAAQFIAGEPDRSVSRVLGVGDAMPAYTYVDQDGHARRFGSDWHGKIVLFSVIFTRCNDMTVCPAISAKYMYLQQHLDPAKFHLVQLTLDPTYDSPAVLRQYGGHFTADSARWSLLTGQPAEIKRTLDELGISSIQDKPGNFVHDDSLIYLDGEGHIAQILATAGWNPDDVIAGAQQVAGQLSNPLRRLELASISGIVAFCGGSQTTATVVLDSAVFLLGVGILGSLLAWFGRIIFAREA